MDASWITNDDRTPGFLWFLGAAGSIPLWFAAILVWSDTDAITAQRTIAIAIAYGAVVLSFLGGTRWGTALIANKRMALYRDRLLAIVPGCAGLAAMFMPPVVAFAVLVSLFLGQALWDLTSAHDGRLPVCSALVRVTSTAIAVPALLAMLVRIVMTG